MCNLECDELIPAFSISILASHFCKVDPSNANGAIINFGVVPKSDTIYRIYAYDASQGNTLTGTRIDDCYIENTAADPTQDRIEMDLTIDFSATTHSCGVYLVSLLLRTRVVYMVSLLLRTRVAFSLVSYHTGRFANYYILMCVWKLYHQENLSMKCIPHYTPLSYSKNGVYRGIIPIFLFLIQNIDCRGDSNVYPQSKI